MRSWNLSLMLGLLTTVSVPLMAQEVGADKKPGLRVVLEMADGSRLAGTPAEKSLPVNTGYMTVDIPLEKIRQCEIRRQEERIILSLQNGDKLTGSLERHQFQLETALGKLSPDFAQIDRMTFTTSQTDGLSVSTITLAYIHPIAGHRRTPVEAAAPDSVEGQLRSQGKYWVRTKGGEFTVGAYVHDLLEGRLDQPKGRGALGKILSLSTGDDGKPAAMVDFGCNYSVGIYLSELCLVVVVPETNAQP